VFAKQHNENAINIFDRKKDKDLLDAKWEGMN